MKAAVPILVRSIAFDHPGAASPLVTVRRNAVEPVIVPEWRGGYSIDSDDSVVAFALEGSQDAHLSLEVRLTSSSPGLRSADVRAVSLVDAFPWLPPQPEPILGRAALTTVDFDDLGESGAVLFDLEGVRIWDRGIGVHDVAWCWQARPDANWPWTPIGLSRHRVYVLLRSPRPPWSTQPRSPANQNLPWTDLLEFACRWARGARTPEQVAQLVTRAVYELGSGIVRYDCPGGGGTHYTYPAPSFHLFDCSQFVRLLHGDPFASRWVNCMDCASMVSTTTNALGGELWQSGMFSDDGPFELNPILAIGSANWQTACGWGSFAYHEVAWTGDADSDDAVYDACLLVDGGANPGRPPFLPELPANLRFAAPGAYRDRLAAATPFGRPRCRPRPERSRKRRAVI